MRGRGSFVFFSAQFVGSCSQDNTLLTSSTDQAGIFSGHFSTVFNRFAWVGAKLDIYANDTNAMCCSFFHITGASRAFLRDLADDIWSMRLEKPQPCKHVELQVHFLPTATIPKKEDLAQEIP